MNGKCKYCDYVSKCSKICEYNSIMCQLHRSFPKIVDKSYEQLQQENTNLKQALNEIREYVNKNRHLNWYVEGCRFNDILQIIDKVLGDDEK